ncbi:NAD-dependent epimerase/dehydratase family protein [Pseudomonas sp. HY13-MNA-CIBAN-0226]|uniref:NAD-dependent epimerase/dehydratase family protein n=1 Tax=Pseudomonas sp. HY13-MNA-CIBAN-0226 TaxID=3140473 RepID=UPI0033204E24
MNKGVIFISGGAGFIGSHLTDILLKRGYRVRVFDNLSTGKRSNLPLENPLVQLIEGNIADPVAVAQAMNGCTAVVHLAAVASVQASVDDPINTHQSNFVGTLNVCEAMRQLKISRILFASSAAVYGGNGEGQAIGEDTPKSPLTPYASDKLASEYYIDFYRRQHAFESAIFRFFNIFGPRQDPASPYSGVISIFADRVQKNLPITVFGDGEQTRDFVYVEDLVQILVQALEAPMVDSCPINIGMNHSTTLNQLIAALCEITKFSPAVVYAPARTGDIRHSLANNKKLATHYKVENKTSLKSGLEKLLAHSTEH